MSELGVWSDIYVCFMKSHLIKKILQPIEIERGISFNEWIDLKMLRSDVLKSVEA